MIAKVCDRESRRDTWFENRLVYFGTDETTETECALFLDVAVCMFMFQYKAKSR